jgi:putative MATE family efflux protein
MVVGHRDVRGTLARLAVPNAASLFGDQLLGIVDTIVIGSLGTASLAAVTGATSVFIAIVLGLHGLTQGVGVLGAQAIGAGDNRRFGAIVRAGATLPVAIGALIAFASLGLARPGLHLMMGDLVTLDAGATYLILRCFSLVAIAISSIAYTAFAAAGDTKFGLKLLLVVNAVHIPLVFVLALGIGTHHAYGIVGAGISSLVAEIMGVGYSISAAIRRRHYHIFESLKIDISIALRCAWLGLPEAVYLFLIVAPDIAIVTILAPLGSEAVAAFRALIIVTDATWSIPGSLGTAIQTVLGQRFGAGDIAGAQDFDRRARRYTILVCSASAVVIAALAWPIAALCTLNPVLASIAAVPLAVHMTTLPLKGYAMASIARIRASGDTRFSMIVGVIASVIVIPGVFFCVNVLHVGLFAIPISWITAWLFWCGAAAIRLHNFDWARAQLAV